MRPFHTAALINDVGAPVQAVGWPAGCAETAAYQSQPASNWNAAEENPVMLVSSETRDCEESLQLSSVVLLKHLESTSPYQPVTGSVSKRTTWIRAVILSLVPVLLITHNNNNKTHPDILLIRSWVVLWSCSLDFKVAWLCCCNFILSQTDRSLQLMNVSHLSRLASSTGSGDGAFGLKKKYSKKKKKVNLEGVDICSVLPYPSKLESWGKC